MNEELKQRAKESIRDGITIGTATQVMEHHKKTLANSDPRKMWTDQYLIARANEIIALMEAVIELLEEQAIETEAVTAMEQATKSVYHIIRKYVAILANKLRRAGLGLSRAFKAAWNYFKGMSREKPENKISPTQPPRSTGTY